MLVACLLIAWVAAVPARGETAIARGSPQAAFAGGPIHLSGAAEARLRGQYHGDNVPVVPQPFRTWLDAALLAGDWRQVEAVKKALIAARDLLPVLLWDQTRFVATGRITLAAEYAKDWPVSDVPNAEEAAATMWLYAVAATFTDGHKCSDPQAREAYLDRLRGADFAAVMGIIRSMPEDRLAASRGPRSGWRVRWPLSEPAMHCAGAPAGGWTSVRTGCRSANWRTPARCCRGIWRRSVRSCVRRGRRGRERLGRPVF